MAAGLGFAPVLEILLSAQAVDEVVSKPNARGIYPLHAAASNGSPECVTLLLVHGAAPDVRDKNGATPAAVAAFCGSTDALKAIIEHANSSGLDKEAVDAAGATMLWTAAAGGHAEAVAYLLEKGCAPEASCGNLTCEAVASRNGHAEVAALFTKKLDGIAE